MNDSLLPIGHVLLLGKYRIERQLASGGFGNTYEIVDLQFHKRYAIKEFFMKSINGRKGSICTVSVNNRDNVNMFGSQLEKFKKEARRLRKLNNPHIVRVHDLFMENNTAYYVMDYVDGESLSNRLKQTGKPLSEGEAIQTIFQVLEALDEIHQKGIWHLDLKPGNIMIDKTGKAILIDFGASKQISLSEGQTSTSTAMCYTPGYAPPEQIDKKMELIGPWTDLYALGATLYNLLTCNQPPTVSEMLEPDAFSYSDSVSDSSRNLVKWLMSPNRRKRPQSVAEVRTYLDEEGMAFAPINNVVIIPSKESDVQEQTVVTTREDSKLISHLTETSTLETKDGNEASTDLITHLKEHLTLFKERILYFKDVVLAWIKNDSDISTKAKCVKEWIKDYTRVVINELKRITEVIGNFRNSLVDIPEDEERATPIGRIVLFAIVILILLFLIGVIYTRTFVDDASDDSISANEEMLKDYYDEKVDDCSFRMILVNQGEFLMGSPNTDPLAEADESPAHIVSLDSYYIGETEVTQALWETVMGTNPSKFKNVISPVEQVTWHQCLEFIEKLNRLTQKQYRLPTEAEWEYAARGGKKSHDFLFSGAIRPDEAGWYEFNSEGRTHRVHAKHENELGLFDMSGNVWEWCQDWYDIYASIDQSNPHGAISGSHKVIRGGGWNNNSKFCRVTFRGKNSPNNFAKNIGLRLAISANGLNKQLK